ncbi:MAG: hypothetical protein II467_06405 [Bacilli bacterium]|nr:hypothetical protein [Bacilli bacterium]
MNRRRKGKEKLPLLLSAAVSILAVFTASVSTFAWFKATANAKVSGYGQATDINVSASESLEVDATLYYCIENRYESPNKGYPNANQPTLTFDADDLDNGDSLDSFIPVSSDAQKNLNGIYPGYKMTFMIKLSSPSVLGGIGLELKDLTPARAGRASSAENPATDVRHEFGGGFITLANAIRIGVFVIDDEKDFVSASVTDADNQFVYSPAYENYVLKPKAGSFGANAYIFYTVYFDDEGDGSTKTKYLEYTDDSYESLIIGDTPSNTTRYFKQDANGNSNAYEGLSFVIKTLKVTVG